VASVRTNQRAIRSKRGHHSVAISGKSSNFANASRPRRTRRSSAASSNGPPGSSRTRRSKMSWISVPRSDASGSFAKSSNALSFSTWRA
jgi:hypothetical protein